MYFWKVDSLVEDFKSEKVSQKEEFKYILALTVLMAIFTNPLWYISHSYNIYDSISTVSLLIVSIWGIYYCYKINSEGDNKDFIVRGVCLGLPVMIRVFVFMIPVFILLGIFEEMTSEPVVDGELNPEVYTTSIYIVITTIIFAVFYYIYLAKKIRAVSSYNA